MPLCSTSCGGSIPPISLSDCAVTTKKGGICYLVFSTCDINFDDVYNDCAVWVTGVEACKIRILPEVMAEKPLTSVTKARITSCGPEQVISETHTINFSLYEYDTENLTCVFFNQMKLQPSRFHVGYFDSQGNFYGFHDFGIEVNEVIPNNENELSHYEGVITIEGIEIFCPVEIPCFDTGDPDCAPYIADVDCAPIQLSGSLLLYLLENQATICP